MTYQRGFRLPSEFALAAAACRAVAGGTDGDIDELARAVEWARFGQLLGRHRIEALAAEGLERLSLAPPPPLADQLADARRRAALDGLRAADLSARLLDRFATAGVPLLFVKGLTLSALAYGNGFAKQSKDIDLLVTEDDLPRAAELLSAHGYRTVRGTRGLARHRAAKESEWFADDLPPIDLHHRLANPGVMAGVDGGSESQIVRVAPQIDLPTLTNESLLVYLCVHGAESGWFRLKWLLDLDAALRSRPVARLTDAAGKLGAARHVAVAMGMIRWLDSNGAATGDRDPVTRRSIALLLDPVEPLDRRFGTVPLHAIHFLLAEGPAGKAREVYRQAREWWFNRS